MAPEINFSEDYGVAADTYSFGLVLVEIWSRREVGKDGFAQTSPANCFKLDLDSLRAMASSDVPGSFLELSMQCCSYEKDERPSMEDALGWIDDLLNELHQDLVPPPGSPREISVHAYQGRTMSVTNMSFDQTEKRTNEPQTQLEFFESVLAEGLARGVTISDEQRTTLCAIAKELAVEPSSGEEAPAQLCSTVTEKLAPVPSLPDSMIGWLHKKGRSWPRNWKVRYFRLSGNQLDWWRNEPLSLDSLPDESMDIRGCTCVVFHDKHRYRWTIMPPENDPRRTSRSRVTSPNSNDIFAAGKPKDLGPSMLQLACKSEAIALRWLSVLKIKIEIPYE